MLLPMYKLRMQIQYTKITIGLEKKSTQIVVRVQKATSSIEGPSQINTA